MDNNQEPVTQTEEKNEESVDTQATKNKDEGGKSHITKN